jgi:hypothetical protein
VLSRGWWGAVPFVTIAKLAIQRAQRSKSPVGDTYTVAVRYRQGLSRLYLKSGRVSLPGGPFANVASLIG